MKQPVKLWQVCTIDIVFLSVMILAMRVTAGFALIALILLGCLFAFSHKGGLAATCYLSIFLLQNINYAVIPQNIIGNVGCKVGYIMIALAMFVTGSGNRSEKLPLGLLWLYLFWMSIVSATGWFPIISYLKLANYAMFVAGSVILIRFIQHSGADLLQVRAIFLAISFVMTIGSALTYPFPDICYSMDINKAARYGIFLTGEQVLDRTQQALFNGLTWHSQVLAPILAASFIWTACDMFFIEKRITIIHAMILFCAPILIYMTRSRTGLLTLFVALIIFFFYACRKVVMPHKLRRHINIVAGFLLAVALGSAIVLEIQDSTLTKWVRKNEDIQGDTRTLTDAVVSTRMLAVESNLDDFLESPIMGTGFQVTRNFKYIYGGIEITSLISAPCEKGITPLVVLAEGGIVGGVIFYMFVLVFYAKCVSKRRVVLVVMFTVILISNLSESTFFSPSGAGGYMWIFAFIGGLICDLAIEESVNARLQYVQDNQWAN